jgi:hypothetical protein
MKITSMKRTSLILAAGAITSCASTGSNLVLGKSTTADVERELGRPAERVDVAGGDSVWFYPRGLARSTQAVRVGPDGVVREVSQVLTPENFGIELGKSTAADVKAILGPPFTISSLRRSQREVWEPSADRSDPPSAPENARAIVCIGGGIMAARCARCTKGYVTLASRADPSGMAWHYKEYQHEQSSAQERLVYRDEEQTAKAR